MIFDYISNKQALPFEQKVAQNFTAELQWSPNFLIGNVFSGQVTIHYDMKKREFHLHDIFFFLPMQSFSFVYSSEDARVLFISIDEPYLSQLCSNLSDLRLSQHHLAANLSSQIYVQLCTDFSTIIFNNLKTEFCTRMRLLSAATHMANVIFENFGIISDEGTNGKLSSADRRTEILSYIRDHYKNDIAVTQIAKELGLHPQYFSSYFHKQFGTSFVEYLSNYRINSSLYDLVYTDNSILNIALNNGFHSHKTYSIAFKKLYNCTPMEYRRNNRHYDTNEAREKFDQDSFGNSVGIFSYFRQFLQSDTNSESKSSHPRQVRHQQTIEIDASHYGDNSLSHSYINMLSCGRAYSVLRSEVQEQIHQAHEELGFTHLRIRDIFSDDLNIYYEDEVRGPIYSWHSLDVIFDFILSIGVIPFPELGYMPERMASKKQYSGVLYKPNVSMPKDYNLWSDMIRAFLTHYIDRYGLSEVQKWMFTFWTSPDLKMKNPYWNEPQEEFFKFYKITYDAIKSVDESLKFGSANFSTFNGFPWYENFFQFCYANHIFPSFVDFHVYGTEPIEAESPHDTFLKIHAENYSIANQNIIHTHLQTIHQIMNRTGFRSLDVIVSDWNLSFLPKDLIRDSCYMGPFICHTLISNIGLYKSMCFWTLSDIHEDAFPESRMFTGGPGLLDYHGLRKASYNALMLINRLSNNILKIGSNYVFTESNGRFQLLIYNLARFDHMFSSNDQSAMDESRRYQIYNTDNLYVNIMLNLPNGNYYVRRSEVNRSYGSAYDLWSEAGSPATLHKEMEDYLRESSVPHVKYSLHNSVDVLVLAEEVPAHGVLLLEFIPFG